LPALETPVVGSSPGSGRPDQRPWQSGQIDREQGAVGYGHLFLGTEGT
jgi:hypothetical protein